MEIFRPRKLPRMAAEKQVGSGKHKPEKKPKVSQCFGKIGNNNLVVLDTRQVALQTPQGKIISVPEKQRRIITNTMDIARLEKWTFYEEKN